MKTANQIVLDLQNSLVDLGVKPDGIIGQNTVRAFGIKNNIKLVDLAHFFGQCYHETSGFKTFVENLNYSKQGLLNTFPKYFDEVSASQNQYKPKQIANIVYSNRYGNGNQEGYLFRGRGAIQLTFRDNYERFNNWLKLKGINIDVLSNPDNVLEVAFLSGLFYFEVNKLFGQTDISEESIKKVTRKINGGYNGLAHRIIATKLFYYGQ